MSTDQSLRAVIARALISNNPPGAHLFGCALSRGDQFPTGDVLDLCSCWELDELLSDADAILRALANAPATATAGVNLGAMLEDAHRLARVVKHDTYEQSDDGGEPTVPEYCTDTCSGCAADRLEDAIGNLEDVLSAGARIGASS